MEIIIQAIIIATAVAVTFIIGRKGLVKAVGTAASLGGSYYIASTFFDDFIELRKKINIFEKLEGGTTNFDYLEGETNFFKAVGKLFKLMTSGNFDHDGFMIVLDEFCRTILSFVLLFLVSFFVIRFLTKIISDLIEKRKSIKTVNRVAGILVGIAAGVLVSWFVAKGFTTFAVPFIAEKLPEVTLPDTAEMPVFVLLEKLDALIPFEIFT